MSRLIPIEDVRIGDRIDGRRVGDRRVLEGDPVHIVLYLYEADGTCTSLRSRWIGRTITIEDDAPSDTITA